MEKQTDRWEPADYVVNSKIQYIHALDEFNLGELKGYETVLDIGCGDGRITSFLASLIPNGHVTGIDNSEKMINYANHNFKHQKNVEFVVHDASKEYLSNKFDYILSFSCMHWVKDQLSTFKSIKEALKVNGKLFILLYPRCEVQTAAINEVAGNSEWSKYFVGYENPFFSYNVPFYSNLLNNLNFEINRLEMTPEACVIYETIEHLINFMSGWLPHANEVPAHLRQRFLRCVCEKYSENLGFNMNASIHIPFRKIVISASKL